MFKLFKHKIDYFFSDQRFSEILSGSAWAFGASIFATIFGLFSSVIIAKFYGAELIGIVAIINSFFLFASIFTVLGTDTSILRLIPEHLIKFSPTSAHKIYRNIFYMVFATSIFFGIIFFWQSNLIALIFHKPDWSFYIAIASIFLVFKSLTKLNTQAVRALKLIRIYALMQTFPQGFNFVFLLLLPFFFLGNKNIPVYAFLSSITLTSIFGIAFMEYSFRLRKQKSDIVCSLNIKKILSISAPMMMTSTMAVIISQTSVILLGIFRDEVEIGYYSIAVKLSTLTSFMLSAINSIAAPKFSELFHSDKINELFYVAKKSTLLIFWSSTPILLGLLLFGKPILHNAFGQDFLASYQPLVILVIGQFVNSISGSTGYFMNMTGNENIYKNIMLLTALINIGLNFLLIPTCGIVGASISSMCSLTLWNVSTLIFINRKFGTTTGYFPMIIKR